MRNYNENISKRVNDSLEKREAVVRKQKKFILITVLIMISLVILLGTSVSALASSRGDAASYNKYYKSIRIEAGDTLWTLADEYISDMNIEKTDYIKEICQLNSISEEDTIHVGDYLVVTYYSQDIK